jgi:hypothetical protein
LAACYARWLQDPSQLDGDAFHFYQLASGAASLLDLDQLRAISDGAGAILLWRAVYDFAGDMGVERLPFVGVAFNTLIVAITAAVALRTSRLMFGAHQQRESLLMLAFSSCGLVWIFAAIHLRDGMILLIVALITLSWVRFLQRGGWLGAVGLLVMLPLLSVALLVLRNEFVAVPLVASAIGLCAMLLSPRSPTLRAWRWLALAALLTAAGIVSIIVYGVAETVEGHSSAYRDMVQASSGASSLGAQLVVNQPPLVRALVGPVYLLIFPIPVWYGLLGDSALHAFKALNAVFFYALLPLIAMAVRDVWASSTQHNPDRLFVLGMSGVFLVAISLTSLETRHMGSFLVPMFLLALVPDPGAPGHGRRYRRALGVVLLAMLMLHLAWALAKAATG